MNAPVVHTILIAGAGQLGSRYLQGLAKCRLPLQIDVLDNCPESLARAKSRWHEVVSADSAHTVAFHESMTDLPREIDIAIVATTANVRPQLVSEIAGRSAVRFWVLEKVLAQSVAGLNEMCAHIGNADNAWVNTSRRIMPWHQQIKSHFGSGIPLVLEVKGGRWGLACNSIHLLDLLAWWSGETLLSVTTVQLDSTWLESKRQGYWEVFGTLEANYTGGSRALLSVTDDDSLVSFTVCTGQNIWHINEATGLATCSDGTEAPGRISYQGEITASLVESILEQGCCNLPSLQESAALHRVFIQGMQEHWVRAGNPGASFVPIT